jgi:hypothetical protein
MIPQRLGKFAQQIRALNPDVQAIPYYVDTWRRYLPADGDLNAIAARFPHEITRKNLRVLSRSAACDPALRRQLFLATMIWGYGTMGRGPWRVEQMMSDMDRQAREFPSSTNLLDRTVSLLTNGDVSAAYQEFALKWCGPAFFSKFFYVVGLGANCDPLPLTLDSRVAHSWKLFHRDNVLDYRDYICGPAPEDPNPSPVQWYPEGYVRYVETVNGWAKDMGCRADAIEMFLFEPPGGYLGTAT